jgi:hypothetical protein
MALPNHDRIAEIAGDQAAYDGTNVHSLSLEQGIRLLQLHKMHKTRADMVKHAQELKDRHQKVQELHRLLQLVNKHTSQEAGDDRGSIKLTHPQLNNQHVDLAADLTRVLKKHTKQRVEKDGRNVPYIDLKGEEMAPVRMLLDQAKAEGMELSNQELYEGEQIGTLLESVRALTNIDRDEAWTQVQGIRDLRKGLQEAHEQRQVEIKWPVDSYNRDERDALVSALDMACKDLNLQNDLQMQDLNRVYQDRLEVLQMARSIMKNLHDDKVHKARSANGR